jgi:hypothetical protein
VSGEEQKEAPQTGGVWERYKFDDLFENVFKNNVDSETLYYIYKKLRANILATPPSASIGGLDAVFSLTQQILERVGGLDEIEELRKTYVKTLKSFIKIIFMATTGEDITIISDEIESTTEGLMLAIRDAVIALVSKVNECEDHEDS